ncbi:hypothetical protein TrRE_jg7416 [Triparma retinervis]|uniref:3-oxo-5-alpha-steroid 4-dehydrogenase C-terminal domain-containing protein n=1 Tax=Triparma retinervis TaxID=2557542 RepID=A0A9W7E858_9STRA|nr:hypothetical protein TrRE_jg7416 [Triparma retinervis]
MHCLRRLYECLRVHEFRGEMTLTGFLVGCAHYTITSVLFTVPPPSTSSPVLNRILPPIGIVIFFLSSLNQHKAHLALSRQPRTPSIPYPPLPKTSEFKVHSCPHYVAEVNIYLAFCAMHQTAGSVACAVWVATNLTVGKISKDKAKGNFQRGWLWGGGWGEGNRITIAKKACYHSS